MKKLTLSGIKVNLDNAVEITRKPNGRAGDIIRFIMPEFLSNAVIKGKAVETKWEKIKAMVEGDENFVLVGDWLILNFATITTVAYQPTGRAPQMQIACVSSGNPSTESFSFQHEDAEAREIWKAI